MSGGGHNHKPHAPHITADKPAALPGRGERLTGQENLEQHRAFVLEKHQEHAKPYFETAKSLFAAQRSIPTPEAKLVEFKQIDGGKALLEAMNTTTGTFNENDNTFMGYMQAMTMQKFAEAKVNLDALDASPNGDIPAVQEERLANRFGSLGEKVRQITDKQHQQQTKLDDLKAVSTLETAAEKAERLAKIDTLEREVASYKEQAEVLDTYRGKLWDATNALPAGNEADNFFRLTEDAKTLRLKGDVPSDALINAITEARQKLNTAYEFRVAETNAFQVMALYEQRIPNDVSQLEPDAAITETWKKQPSWPASEMLEAELRAHNDRQDYLYALETDLAHASNKEAFWNATIPRKLARIALKGTMRATHGVYSAYDKHQQKRFTARDVTRKPGETDREFDARRRPWSNKAIERDRRRRPGRRSRLEKLKSAAGSDRAKYEEARDAYLDEKLKYIIDDNTLSDSEVFRIRTQAAVEENSRMITLTNEHARKSGMGYANWLVHERLNGWQKLAVAASITAIGGPGMLALTLAGYAGSRADHAMRGKMGKRDNAEAWKKKMEAGLAKEGHKRLKRTLGGRDMTLETMRGLAYDQKFLTMKEINAYLGGHYNKALAGEMARRIVGPAVGFAALGGISNLDKLWIIDSFPSPMGLLETLDEATTPTTPDGSYGARAMSQRIGMN